MNLTSSSWIEDPLRPRAVEPEWQKRSRKLRELCDGLPSDWQTDEVMGEAARELAEIDPYSGGESLLLVEMESQGLLLSRPSRRDIGRELCRNPNPPAPLSPVERNNREIEQIQREERERFEQEQQAYEQAQQTIHGPEIAAEKRRMAAVVREVGPAVAVAVLKDLGPAMVVDVLKEFGLIPSEPSAPEESTGFVKAEDMSPEQLATARQTEAGMKEKV